MLGWGGGDWNSEDEKGWANPENVDQFDKSTQIEKKIKKVLTSIITTDFAMQNVIMQMKIPLLNLDGKVITKVKSYVLECFSCWKVCRDMSARFCPTCGKETILKVTCEFKEDGSLILYRKKNKVIKTRGKRYPIPLPKGGRDINGELILNNDGLNKPKVISYIRK